mgnify:FL=1
MSATPGNVIELLEATLADPGAEIEQLLTGLLREAKPNRISNFTVPSRHAWLYHEAMVNHNADPMYRQVGDDNWALLEGTFVGNRKIRLVFDEGGPYSR